MDGTKAALDTNLPPMKAALDNLPSITKVLDDNLPPMKAALETNQLFDKILEAIGETNRLMRGLSITDPAQQTTSGNPSE